MKQCPAITSKGEPCQGYVHPSKEYCPAHDPARAEARKRASSIAGRSKQGSEISEIKRKLKELYADTRSGKIPTNVGQVCGTIAGVQLKAVELELRERETVVKEREFVEIRKPEFEQLAGEVAALKELVEEQNASRRKPWAG